MLSYAKKAEGVATICGPLGQIHVKTATCGHCDRIMMVQSVGDGVDSLGRASFDLRLQTGAVVPKQEGTHVCHQCWSLVCDRCHADGRCTPLVKRLEEQEQRAISLRSMGFAA